MELLPFAGAIATGLLYYLWAYLRAWSKERPSSARATDVRSRLGEFAPVDELQLATNRYHYDAILKKTAFQAIGLTLILLAPGALAVGAFSHSTEVDQSTTSLLLQTMSIGCLVVATMWLKNPTASWTRARLQAETVRLHTHVCLAGLPPYANPNAGTTAHELIHRVGANGIEQLRKEIGQLIGILEAARATPSIVPVDAARADAYDVERIAEQVRFFPKSVRSLRGPLSGSALALRLALLGAFFASLFRWIATAHRPDWQSSVPAEVIEVAVAITAFLLAARAVFGWEGRISLYHSMVHQREEWLRRRDALRSGPWGDVNDTAWQHDFKVLAIAIELAMANEALQWLNLVEREMFEAPL